MSASLPNAFDKIDDFLRQLMLYEETTEVSESSGAENLLKELADVICVANGYAVTFSLGLV